MGKGTNILEFSPPVWLCPAMIPGEPLMREALLRAARACAKARRVPLRTISKLAYGQSADLRRIRYGRQFTVRKWDQAMAWLADSANWPGGIVSAEVEDLFVPQQIAKDHEP